MRKGTIVEYPKNFSGPVRGPMPDFPGNGPGSWRGGDGFDDVFKRPFRDWERDWLRQPFPSRPTRPRIPSRFPRVPFRAPKIPWARIPWRIPFNDPFSWMLPDPFEWVPWGRYSDQGHLAMSGFRFLRQCAVWKELTPPCSDAGSFALRRNDGNVVCFTNQAWSSTILAGDPVPANWGIVSGVNNTGPSSNRCLRNNEAVAFQRLYAGIIPAPAVLPGPQWGPNPNLPEQPGIQPDPLMRPDPNPVETGPNVRPRPGRDPKTITRNTPTTRTRVEIDNPPRHRPPRERTKERKFRITLNDSAAGKFLSWAFGQVTEYSDLVDCLYDALPSSITNKFKRPISLPDGSPYADDEWCVWDDVKGKWNCGVGGRSPGLWTKTRVLWDNYNRIRIGTALECIVQNALIDSAIGKLGKIGVEAAIKQGRPISWEFGPAL